MATQNNTTTINNWGEVKQRLFYGDKEIVNATKRVQPKEGAHQLKYTTREGVDKLFYFADEVTVLDTEGLKLKRQAIRDLHARFMKHEISADQYAAAIVELA